MSLVQITLLKQIYPKTNESLYKPIKINTTTRIAEMLPFYQKRILGHHNKSIESRTYQTRTSAYTRHASKVRPMKYTKVLCHACYQEICIRHLYVSKNGESGKCKFYHLTCADTKNII